MLVAPVGVVTPMLLGFGVGKLARPDESWMLHAFLGAMLAATSVGITARVLIHAGEATGHARRVNVWHGAAPNTAVRRDPLFPGSYPRPRGDPPTT